MTTEYVGKYLHFCECKQVELAAYVVLTAWEVQFAVVEKLVALVEGMSLGKYALDIVLPHLIGVGSLYLLA